MGGQPGMMQQILGVLGLHPAPGVVALCALGVFVLFLPRIWSSQRGEEALRILKRASQERMAEREQQEQLALSKVKGNPNGLWLLAREAMAQGRNNLARQVLAELKATGKLPLERAGLEAQLAGPEGPRDPIHAAVRIERSLGLGGVEEARRLLEEAERRWPGDEAWPELRQRLEAPAPELGASHETRP